LFKIFRGQKKEKTKEAAGKTGGTPSRFSDYRKLPEWDRKAERFTNSQDANRLLTYRYRANSISTRRSAQAFEYVQEARSGRDDIIGCQCG